MAGADRSAGAQDRPIASRAAARTGAVSSRQRDVRVYVPYGQEWYGVAVVGNVEVARSADTLALVGETAGHG